MVAEIDELLGAAVWASATPIKNESGFRRAVQKRILAEGPNPEDLQTLASFREHTKIIANNQQREMSRPSLAVDPAAQVSGEQLLPPRLRAKGAKARRQLSDSSTT